MSNARPCLLTPVYKGDLDRFQLLRESIEACGIDLDHIAVVQAEDMSDFRGLRHSQRLSLVSTADVLPGWLERRRAAWFMGRRNPRRWVAGPPLNGWTVQMYSKLAAVELSNASVVICVDSDMAFVKKIGIEDFQTAGRTHLYRFQDAPDIEMIEWVGRSMRFLGLSPCGLAPRRYTYSPLPMDTEVVRRMRAHIELLHKKHWLRAIVAAPWITEYATYGAFAEYIDKSESVVPVLPTLAGWCWWKSEADDLERRIGEICSNPEVRIIGIQSNLKIDTAQYASAVRRHWSANTKGASQASE